MTRGWDRWGGVRGKRGRERIYSQEWVRGEGGEKGNYFLFLSKPLLRREADNFDSPL